MRSIGLRATVINSQAPMEYKANQAIRSLVAGRYKGFTATVFAQLSSKHQWALLCEAKRKLNKWEDADLLGEAVFTSSKEGFRVLCEWLSNPVDEQGRALKVPENWTTDVARHWLATHPRKIKIRHGA